MTCQCCGADSWSDAQLPYAFAQCGACGVYGNTFNLMEGGPPNTEINTDWPLMRGDLVKSFEIVKRLEGCTSDRFLYDVAGSYGYLTWAALRMGWIALGQDIDLGAARAAKEIFGMDINTQEFEDTDLGNFKGSFVFNHGIEHLRSPDKALFKAAKHLSPGGVIYLAHPCMPSHERAKKLVSNAHQHEWTATAFTNFIAQFPLRVISEEYTDFNNPGVPSQTWIVGHM